ncbi:MAG: ABC transporter permease subunit [Pirellulaceae bacterium]
MIIGPVFTREAAVTPRRTKLYVYRSVYVAGLFLLMCTAWLVMAGTQIITTVGDMARFGANLFQVLAPLQLFLVMFFAAFTSAGAVAQEKDRKTLILLLMTRLNNSELVLGKLLASLLPIFVLVLAAFPLFMATLLFGGVTAWQVVQVFAVTVMSALVAGSIGSFIALWREKTFQTLSLTAMAIVIWLGVSQLVYTGALFDEALGMTARGWGLGLSPVLAVLEAAQPFPSEIAGLTLPGGPVALFLVLMGLLVLAINGLAIGLVRVWNPSREARRGKTEEAEATASIWGAEHDEALHEGALAGETASGKPTPSVADRKREGHVDSKRKEQSAEVPHRHVWDNPVLWRETQTWAYGRKVLIIKVMYLLLAACAAAFLYQLVQSGEAVVRGDDLGTAVPPTAWGLVPLYLISVIIINALAVTAITNERDGQALDLLLVTDLSPREFIFGKLGGVLWVTREMLVAPIAITFYLLYAEVMSPISLFYAVGGLLVIDVFVAMLGLHCGMIYANSRTAIGVSMGTVFFLFLGVITCVLLMISFTESFQFQLFPFLGFIAGGGLGLYVAIGYRNPSPAMTAAAFAVPLATFYAIVTFLLEKGFEVFLVTAMAYGFTTLAMLIPALFDLDIEVGRRAGQDDD